jgi:cation diffusion facilitator CzcD-associated flavoprotein CzcO
MIGFNKEPFTEAVIIGAGFSGLAMACQLRRKLGCDDYVIYDRSAAPGGAWWANKCTLSLPV